MFILILTSLFISCCSEDRYEEAIINGMTLRFTGGKIKHIVEDQNKDVYNISKMVFKEGDVVIDVGANIGGFCIPLAKRYPFLKIFSFEPEKKNVRSLKKNIEANKVQSGVITVVGKGLSKDGRNIPLQLSRDHSMHTMVDGPQAFLANRVDVIESITLSQIFSEFKIEKCKVLKLDCEGCEYEVLNNTPDVIFNKIESLRGEFHEFDELKTKGDTPASLHNFIKQKVKDVTVFFLKYPKIDPRSEKGKAAVQSPVIPTPTQAEIAVDVAKFITEIARDHIDFSAADFRREFMDVLGIAPSVAECQFFRKVKMELERRKVGKTQDL